MEITTTEPKWCIPFFRLKIWMIGCLRMIAASLFIGLCAQIKISLSFTPVPLTGQTFAVLLVGCLLGRRQGAGAALLYLIEGCLGLPVWAGGASGFLHLMGPTGGYRIAYILQAYLAGRFVERHGSFHFIKTAFALMMICGIQMGLGVVWLGCFIGWKNIVGLGFLPFIPGEALKALFVTFSLPRKSS